MDENKSTSKRGNSLNEDEREIANMDESDFFFLLMESRIIQASYNTATPLHASASYRALTGCCLFRITNATCRPRLALSRAYRSRATRWLVIRLDHDRGNHGGQCANAIMCSHGTIHHSGTSYFRG